MNGVDLKLFRKKLGISQEELGMLVGLSKNTIYNYENNNEIPKSKIPVFEKLFTEKKILSTNENQDNKSKLSEKEAIEIIEKLLVHENELMKYENFSLWVKSIRTDERNKTLKEVLKNRLNK